MVFPFWTMADKCDVSRYHSQIVFHFDNAEDNISFLFTEEIVDDKKKGVILPILTENHCEKKREKLTKKKQKKMKGDYFFFTDLRWRKDVVDNGHFRWRNRSTFFVSRFYTSYQLSGLFQLYGSRSKGWVFIRQKMDNTKKAQSWTGTETWLEGLLVTILYYQKEKSFRKCMYLFFF